MLTAKETELAMERFFNDCVRFWSGVGFDERNAFEAALEDTKKITTNPFSPRGDKLDPETKLNFIKYREMDLGRR